MQRHSLLIFLLVWLGLWRWCYLLTWKWRKERQVTGKEHRIQVMAGIALREWALLFLWITLFFLCLTLSLSLFLLSLAVSVRCCSVQCRAWPHVLHTSKYASALRLVPLLPHCHSPLHGLSHCNGVIRTGWRLTPSTLPEPVQCKVASEYKCFLTPRQLALDTE